ncbi:MAG: endonuclease NucS domain-containing protein [Gemmatimonadaceae bacterium]
MNKDNDVSERPPVWRLVHEATEHLAGPMTYAEIKDYIRTNYGDINDSTMTCQIVVCSVNHPSRIHYPENKKARSCDSQYDFLFHTGRGRVERYNPQVHGDWEIWADEYGKLSVRKAGLGPSEEEQEDTAGENVFCFPLESHLRDFIAANLSELGPAGAALQLYEDGNGRDGIEYPTAVGPIDILATDPAGNLVVFELKLSKGPDRAVGQILRYMGWVKKVLAGNKTVSGVIVAQQATDKLKFAVSLVPSISVFEYRLRFDLDEVKL